MADENKEDIKFNKWQVAGAIIAVIALLSIPLFVYFTAGSLSNKGQWGDFFGGTLNPTLTFLTFLGLLYTIILQKNELGLSRKELELTREEVAKSATALNAQNDSMKQQRFETTLFSMIGVFNQIIDQMDIEIIYYSEKPITDNYRGRDCFTKLKLNLAKYYEERSWNTEPMYNGDRNPWSDEQPNLIEYPHDEYRIIDAYNYLYEKHASDLGHYFRVLFNIFNFIKKSDYSGLSDQSANRIYAKILRAQLSDQELLILYYNCLSDHGVKFKQLAIEFELFDNLNVGNLIREDHVKLMDRKAFGNNVYFQELENDESGEL